MRWIAMAVKAAFLLNALAAALLCAWLFGVIECVTVLQVIGFARLMVRR